MSPVNDDYNLAFKLKVVEKAQTEGLDFIASQYAVPLKLLQSWVAEFSIGPNEGWLVQDKISPKDFEMASGYYRRELAQARTWISLLQTALDYFAPGKYEKFQFIAAFANSETFEDLCKVTDVSKSEFQEWVEKIQDSQSIRNIGKPNLVRQVLKIGEESNGDFPYRTYLTKASILLYYPIAKEIAIRKANDDSKMQVADSPNEYYSGRYTDNRIQQVWISDVAPVNTDDGLVNITLIIDLMSRHLLGWSMSKTDDAGSTTIAAWEMAEKNFLEGRTTLLLTGNDEQFVGSEFKERIGIHSYVNHHVLWSDQNPEESNQ